MKSFKLLYPTGSVINLLQRLLKIKGYEITSVNEQEGVIKAVKKRRLKKDRILQITVSKFDNNITNLELSLKVKSRSKHGPPESAEREEAALLNSIDNYF